MYKRSGSKQLLGVEQLVIQPNAQRIGVGELSQARWVMYSRRHSLTTARVTNTRTQYPHVKYLHCASYASTEDSCLKTDENVICLVTECAAIMHL